MAYGRSPRPPGSATRRDRRSVPVRIRRRGPPRVLRQTVGLGAEQPRGGQVQDPSVSAVSRSAVAVPVVASMDRPAPASTPTGATGSAARTTGRWNKLPADARTALGLNRGRRGHDDHDDHAVRDDHASAPSATSAPSAPSAPDDGCPRCRGRWSAPAPPAASVSRPAARPGRCPGWRSARRCLAGVTASDSAAAARSVTWVTSTPAAYAALITSTCFVAAASVTYGSMTAPGFSRADPIGCRILEPQTCKARIYSAWSGADDGYDHLRHPGPRTAAWPPGSSTPATRRRTGPRRRAGNRRRPARRRTRSRIHTRR